MLLPFVDILDGLLALICIIIALYLALMMVLYVFGIPRLVIHFSLSLPITRMAFLLFGVFSSKEIQSWLDPLIVWSVNGIWLLLNVSKLSMVMLVVLNVFKYLFSFSLLFPFFLLSFLSSLPFLPSFSLPPSPLFIFLSHCRPAHCSLMMNLLFSSFSLLSFSPFPLSSSSPLCLSSMECKFD